MSLDMHLKVQAKLVIRNSTFKKYNVEKRDQGTIFERYVPKEMVQERQGCSPRSTLGIIRLHPCPRVKEARLRPRTAFSGVKPGANVKDLKDPMVKATHCVSGSKKKKNVPETAPASCKYHVSFINLCEGAPKVPRRRPEVAPKSFRAGGPPYRGPPPRTATDHFCTIFSA